MYILGIYMLACFCIFDMFGAFLGDTLLPKMHQNKYSQNTTIVTKNTTKHAPKHYKKIYKYTKTLQNNAQKNVKKHQQMTRKT